VFRLIKSSSTGNEFLYHIELTIDSFTLYGVLIDDKKFIQKDERIQLLRKWLRGKTPIPVSEWTHEKRGMNE
jgi:hypothetical protein